MKHSYTYSMPQAFIDDKNVALKWRIYGYLNGFWINGNTVYARNDTIASKFSVSERAVQSALKELEDMGLCSRDVSGMKRLILPGGIVKGGRSPASPPHEAQLRPRGEAQLHHISDSNSDRRSASQNEAHRSEEDEVRITPTDDEGNEVEKKIKRGRSPVNAAARRVEKYFAQKAQKYTDKRVIIQGYTHIKRLLEQHGLTERQLVSFIDEYFDEVPTDERASNIFICLAIRNINKRIANS